MTEVRLLRVNADYCSKAGRRQENQDFVGLSCDGSDPKFGHVAAVADGVSFGNAGRAAAELAVRSFIEAHHDANPTNGVARNAARALASFNAWLHHASCTDAPADDNGTVAPPLERHDARAHGERPRIKAIAGRRPEKRAQGAVHRAGRSRKE
jgi:serine/threonine protein phosphatase PrpC